MNQIGRKNSLQFSNIVTYTFTHCLLFYRILQNQITQSAVLSHLKKVTLTAHEDKIKISCISFKIVN